VRKITTGYEAAGFGRDMSPLLNIVVRSMACAMFHWEADACRTTAHGAMASAGCSRDMYGPAATVERGYFRGQCEASGSAQTQRYALVGDITTD
jgi:hypothetical protein